MSECGRGVGLAAGPSAGFLKLAGQPSVFLKEATCLLAFVFFFCLGLVLTAVQRAVETFSNSLITDGQISAQYETQTLTLHSHSLHQTYSYLTVRTLTSRKGTDFGHEKLKIFDIFLFLRAAALA